MRIKIKLSPKQYPAWIPLNHHSLAACIYSWVSIGSPEFGQFIHDEGIRLNSEKDADRRFKFFVFALPQLSYFSFEGEYKRFESGEVIWQISSPLIDFMEALITGLKAQEFVRIGKSLFSVEAIEEPFTPLFTSEMRFIALSPLTVATTTRDANDRRIKHFLRASEKDFGNLVVSNLLSKYQALTGKEIEDKSLHFQFDKEYIDRVGGYESRKISRLIRYGDIEIKSVLSPFIVSGNPELIRLGWESGFGSNNSQGFGMAGI